MNRNDWRWWVREMLTGLAFALCCALLFIFLLLIEPAHAQTIDVSFTAQGEAGCWEVEPETLPAVLAILRGDVYAGLKADSVRIWINKPVCSTACHPSDNME